MIYLPVPPPVSTYGAAAMEDRGDTWTQAKSNTARPVHHQKMTSLEGGKRFEQESMKILSFRGKDGLAYSGLRFRSRRQTGGLTSSVSHTLCCDSRRRLSSVARRNGAGVAKIGKDTSQRRIINHMRKGETKSNTRQLLHLLTRSGRSLPQYFIILQGDKVFITTTRLCVFAFLTVIGQVSAVGKG